MNAWIWLILTIYGFTGVAYHGCKYLDKGKGLVDFIVFLIISQVFFIYFLFEACG